jgi:glycosyltransferase involved in cell wall biosynthesis
VSRRTITAVIGVYNEEHNLPRCLRALAWCDEVIVVDKFSTDRTPEIARSFPNIVFLQNEDWLNVNINLGIERAKGDWILRIDADEIASPELAEEIQHKVLASPIQPCDGYWVPNRVFFFGKWIRYGVALDTRFGNEKPGYGWRQILFRKGYADYPCVRQHEELRVKGNWGRLNGHYDHFSHRTVSQWIGKMNLYTDLDVGRTDVLAPGYVAPKTSKTVVALALIFYRLYIKRNGYRDGIHGFITCALNTAYILVERAKVWEKQFRLTHPDEIAEY